MKSPDAGKSWQNIANGAITSITIEPPTAAKKNMGVFALGDAEFTARMTKEGKKTLSSSHGRTYFEILNDVPITIHVKEETISPEKSPGEEQVEEPPVEMTRPGQPAGTVAANGILQIYENDPRIPLWVMGHGNWQDRASGGSPGGSGKDTTVSLSGQVRWGVKVKSGAGDGSQDLGKALQEGYLDSPDDYKSIEMTGFVEITDLASDDSDQDVTWFGPSGRHTGNGDEKGPGDKGCMGSCYKGSLHAKNGKNRMAFENWHVSYAYIGWKDALNDVIKQMTNKTRVGFKWVKMVVGSGADAYARCEIWVQTSATPYKQTPTNEWQLIRVQEDHNDWPDSKGMNKCGCQKSNQAMVWGAPSVVYRWDNQSGKLSLATVQEIKVPMQFYKEGDKVTARAQTL
jgi:hypothetical protein